jgi:hypothetical protein
MDIPSLPIAISPDDISYQLALNAYSNLSHDAERNAKSTQNDYVTHVTNVWSELRSLVKCPEQEALLPALLEDYKTKYLAKLRVYLEAQTRCASAWIVGPANFPVARNEKRMRIADKRLAELHDFAETALKRMKKAIIAKADQASRKQDEYDRLMKETLWCLEQVAKIEAGAPFGKAGFTNALVGKLARSANNGFRAEVKAILEWLRDNEKAYVTKRLFAPNNNVWTFLTLPEPHVETTNVTQGDTVTGEVTLKINQERNGVELHFTDKPVEKVLTMLRLSAFTYSRRQNLWYARRDESNLEFANSIVDVYKGSEASDMNQDLPPQLPKHSQPTI